MIVTVSYSNGRRDEEYDSIQGAVWAVRQEYPECVIYDAGGFKRTVGSADHQYDVRSGRAALVWRTQSESKNDDGGRAVASINVG